MKKQGMLVILVPVTLAMGRANEEWNIMKEMMEEMKMNELLAKIEADLAASKEDLTKNELATSKADLLSKTNELEKIMRTLPSSTNVGPTPISQQPATGHRGGMCV